MTKDELKTRLEAAEKQMIGLQDEIQNLKAKLDEVQDGEIPEFPVFERGSDYYAFGEAFDVEHGEHSGVTGKSHEDDDLYNAFHTKEYADEFAQKCKLIAMMLHCRWYLDSGFVADYENGRQVKWFVYHDHHYGKYIVKQNHNLQEQPNVYFSTEEKAKKCADWLNEHWKEDGND